MPTISFGSTSYHNPTVKTILDELRPGATYSVGQPVSNGTDDVVAISTAQFNEMSLDSWNDPNSLAAPDGTAMRAEYDRQTTIYNAFDYQRKRESAMPSIADQLDMQYWDQVNGTTTWKDAIAKVKSDNPKP